MSVQLDQVIAGLERGPDGQLELARPPADPRFRRPYGGLYWQIEEAGGLRRSRSLWDAALDLPADTLGDGACMCTGCRARTARTFWCWNARSRCPRGWVAARCGRRWRWTRPSYSPRAAPSWPTWRPTLSYWRWR
jgi:hypothetical protein